MTVATMKGATKCELHDIEPIPNQYTTLSVLRQGLHSIAKHSGRVEEILWLWEHRVVETKGTEVSGTLGRPRRKIVREQYQLLFYLRNRLPLTPAGNGSSV